TALLLELNHLHRGRADVQAQCQLAASHHASRLVFAQSARTDSRGWRRRSATVLSLPVGIPLRKIVDHAGFRLSAGDAKAVKSCLPSIACLCQRNLYQFPPVTTFSVFLTH